MPRAFLAQYKKKERVQVVYQEADTTNDASRKAKIGRSAEDIDALEDFPADHANNDQDGEEEEICVDDSEEESEQSEFTALSDNGEEGVMIQQDSAPHETPNNRTNRKTNRMKSADTLHDRSAQCKSTKKDSNERPSPDNAHRVTIGSEHSAFSRPIGSTNGTPFTSPGLRPDLAVGGTDPGLDLLGHYHMLRGYELPHVHHHRMQAASYWMHMAKVHDTTFSQRSIAAYPGFPHYAVDRHPQLSLGLLGLPFPPPPPAHVHHGATLAPRASATGLAGTRAGLNGTQPRTCMSTSNQCDRHCSETISSSPESVSECRPIPLSPIGSDLGVAHGKCKEERRTDEEDDDSPQDSSTSRCSPLDLSPRSNNTGPPSQASAMIQRHHQQLPAAMIPTRSMVHQLHASIPPVPMIGASGHHGFINPGLIALGGGRRPRDPSKPPPLKKYKCDLCGKAFSRSNTLVTHRRIHTGEKPFVCEVCGRAFRQPGNLTRHRLTHTSHKPYVCPVCHKAFNRASNLQTHMRTHTSFGPYPCPCCSQGFQHKMDLKIHMYTHSSSGARPLPTSV